jgi:hypothetical protein
MNYRERLAQDILKSVKSPRHSSWGLCSPPGCDGSPFLATLEREFSLEQTIHGLRPVPIRISSDANEDCLTFVRKICAKWIASLPASESFSPSRDEPSMMLEELVARLRKAGIFPILLLDRFHKAARVLSAAVLGTLRDLESSQSVFTITVSPVRYDELRSLLRAQGIDYGTCSDYGDMHFQAFLGALDAEECEKYRLEEGLDPEAMEGLIRITGGIPAPLRNAVRLFKGGRTTHEIIAELLKDQDRFIKWLAPQAGSPVFEWIASLYLRLGIREHAIGLRQHSWSRLLLDDHDNLRSELIGIACLRRIKAEGSVFRDLQAVQLYEAGAYDTALRLLSSKPHQDGSGADPLETAIGIMARASVSLEALDIDADWQRIAEEATRAADSCRGHPELKDTEEGFRRWAELASMLSDLRRDIPPDRQLNVLLRGQDRKVVAVRCALFLLLRLEAARRQPPTLGVLLLQSVPESVLRAWASLQLGVGHDHMIDFTQEPFVSRCHKWWARSDGFERPKCPLPAQKLSLQALSVAVGCRQEVALDPALWFFGNPACREQECFLASRLRNPTSHLVAMCRKDLRDRLFQLAHSWLERLVTHCAGVSINDLKSRLAPIPLPPLIAKAGRWN